MGHGTAVDVERSSEVHVAHVGGRGGVTVALVLRRRRRPGRCLARLPVWGPCVALLDHVLHHLLYLLQACLETVLQNVITLDDLHEYGQDMSVEPCNVINILYITLFLILKPTYQINAREFMQPRQMAVEAEAAQCRRDAARRQCARRVQRELVVYNKHTIH